MLTKISVNAEPLVEQGVSPGVRLAVLIDAENVSVD